MSEQNVTKKKTNKLLIVVVIVLLAACCTLGYFLISGKFSGTAKPPKEYSTNLGEFIVNLNDPSPTYIKTTISIGYSNKKGSDTITNKLPQIKDCINKFMLSKTSTDFASNTIEGTGDELIGKINETLGSELITDIYFEQIIIQ
jgi:flagellar FliL protein